MRQRLAIPRYLYPRPKKKKMELMLVFIHGDTLKEIDGKFKKIKRFCRQLFEESKELEK